MKWRPKNERRNSLLMTCHYPGTVWLVLQIGWSKFPPWHSQSEVLARSAKWHFIILYGNQCWLLYQANSKLEILDLSGWHFCLTFRMLTPQPLSGVLEATACIFLYPQRVQRVSSYSWKFAGTLKIKDICSLFEWIFVWLFVRVILFCWLFLLRLKFIWYTAESKKNT